MATAAENLKLTPLPKNTMIVAREDGRLYSVDFSEFPQWDTPGDIDWAISISKIIIGKFQYNRTRFITLEEIDIENVVSTGFTPAGTTKDLEVTVYTTLNGKDVVNTYSPTVRQLTADNIKLSTRVTGENFSIQVRGTYNINTLTVVFHNSGRR